MADLTLTARERAVLAMPVVAGMLREQSPAWWVGPTGVTKRCIVIRTVESGPKWSPGPAALVLIAHYEEAAMRQLRDLGPEHEQVLWSPCWLSLSELRTCLTDATGRAHLAWWVARQPLVAGTDGASARYPDWRPFYAGNRRWGLDQWGPMFSPAESRGNGYVPSLIALDPNDPRLLPDGSRVVDALAIGLVGRHVAGLAVPEVTHA